MSVVCWVSAPDKESGQVIRLEHSDIIGSVPNMYTTYILYDQSKDKYYIGQTSNLLDRLNRHFNNRSKYTKNGNWELVHQETFSSRSEAIYRELYLKSLKSKIALRKIIGL